MKFTLLSSYQPHLAFNTSTLSTIMNLNVEKDTDNIQANLKRLVIFIGDTSGSMDGYKLQQMRHAIRVGIENLNEEVLFSVIAFNTKADVIVSPSPATKEVKQNAHSHIQSLIADGGTLMSKALLAAVLQAKAAKSDICNVYFVTDGENHFSDAYDLEDAILMAKDILSVNCWGIGTDWKPEDLRKISNQLQGTADAVPNPEHLQQKFVESLKINLAKTIKDVKLKLWMPSSVNVKSIKQMSPEILDLTSSIIKVDEKNIELPLGVLGIESRDYHVDFELVAQNTNQQMMVCKPKLIYTLNETISEVEGQKIIVNWSNDDSLTAKIDDQVAHYTGQEELASSIKEGLEAKSRGDIDQATVLLGKAAKIAIETGNEEVTQRLKKVVDVIDASEGTVRLRKGADKGDDMELDMGGTRTIRRQPTVTK